MKANLACALLALAWALSMSSMVMGHDINDPHFWGFALFAFTFAAVFVGAARLAWMWFPDDESHSR